MSFGTLPLAFSVGGKVNNTFTKATDAVKKELGKIGTGFEKLQKAKIDAKPLTTLEKNAKKGSKQAKLLGSELKRTASQSNVLTRSSKLLNNEMLRLKTMGRIDFKLGNVKQQLSDAKGEALALAGTVFALKKTYDSAANVLKAQGELATLKVTEDGIKSITKSGQEMALQFGQVVAPNYIRAAYDIRSGISSLTEHGVNKFTRMSALTAIATKSSIEEMTKLNALGYGIFRKDFGSDFEFGEKFNAGVSATVDSFRTDGSDLSQGLSNLGGTATAMGIAFEQQLAVIGTAKDAYSSASEATTGYKAILNSTGKAQEKLGMNFTNAQGKILPLADILDMLKDRYGEIDVSENVELMEAFGGAEATKFISSMMDKTDQLRKSTIMLQNATSKGMPLVEEMAKGADRGYGFEKLGNAFSYIGYTIGKTLAPAVETLAWGVGGLAQGIAWLDTTFPVLTPVVFGTAAAFASLYAITKTVKLAKLALRFANLSLSKSYVQAIPKVSLFAKAIRFSGIASAMTAAKTTLLAGGFSGLAKGALPMITTAFNALRVAILTNPIGLLATGVVTAGLLIYKYWQPIKHLFSGMFDGFMESMAPVKTALSPFFTLLSPIGSALSFVANKLGQVSHWFGQLLTPVDMAEEKLQGFTSAGKLAGQAIAGAFKVALWPMMQAAKLVGWIGSKLGLISDDSTTVTTLTTGKQPDFGGEVGSNVVAFKPQNSALTPIATNTLPAQLPASNDDGVINQQVKQAVIAAKQHEKQQAQQINKPATVTQQNTIHVVVNNPASDLDVDRAITQAMAKQGSTMLVDEVI